MSQHDFTLEDQAGAAFRADLNSALAAIVSQNSGAAEPATMFAYQFWADTTSGLLKQRNAANSAWITIGTLASANLGLASLAANTFTGVQRWAKGADVASASALTLGTDGNYFDVTGTTTVTSIGTLGVGTVVKMHFDGALTLTHHATDLILPGAANITTAAGDEAELVEYATGDWRMVGGVKADGTAWVVSGGGGGVIAAMRNLTAFNNTGTPNSQIDLAADEIVVKDSSNASQVLYALSVTLNIATSGANGLDTGSEASSTWYYLWAIAKADGTKAGLISASSTAPTMPSGYTYKALVGAAYNDGSSNFVVFRQHDRAWRCAERNIFTSTAGTNSYASLSLTAFIPPIAKTVHGNAGTVGTGQRQVWFASNSAGLGAQAVPAVAAAVLDTYSGAGKFSVMIETAQTVYWKGSQVESYYRAGCIGFDI